MILIRTERQLIEDGWTYFLKSCINCFQNRQPISKLPYTYNSEGTLYTLNLLFYFPDPPSTLIPPCLPHASQRIILFPCWQCQISVYVCWAVCRQVINNYQRFCFMSWELYFLLTLEEPWEKNLSLTHTVLIITDMGIHKTSKGMCPFASSAQTDTVIHVHKG